MMSARLSASILIALHKEHHADCVYQEKLN